MHVPGIVAPAFGPQEQCLAEHQPHAAEQGQSWIGQATNRDAIEPIDASLRTARDAWGHHGDTMTALAQALRQRPHLQFHATTMGRRIRTPQQHEDVQCSRPGDIRLGWQLYIHGCPPSTMRCSGRATLEEGTVVRCARQRS